MGLRILIGLLLILAVNQNSFAKTPHKNISIGPVPAWINTAKLPSSPFVLAEDLGVQHIIVDTQNKYDKNSAIGYRHRALSLQTSDAVENNSTISLHFDPEYQKLKFHHVAILRGGKRIDKLDLSKLKVFSTETDQNRLIYNGNLTANFILSDIRVGDTLDYSYSVIGKNPAIKPHFSYYADLQYSVPVQYLRRRVLVNNTIPVYEKSYVNASAPKTRTAGGYKVFEWEQRDVPALTTDSNRPDWHFGYPSYGLTSYKDWADVGQSFARHYKVKSSSFPAIIDIANSIRKKHQLKTDRALAALQFVETEIRYLGIELGSGGYIPRQPKTVLERRFGDCKDMTLLLVAILRELDIPADPMLVDFDLKAGVTNMIQSHTAFDHVIVRAKVGKDIYFFDPTRGEQLGRLDKVEQGNFGLGLIISKDSPGLVQAEPNLPKWYIDIEDKFDLRTPDAGIAFTSVSNFYGSAADSTYSWLERSGKDDISKEYLAYYKDDYPGIEETEPIKVEFFKDEARAKVTATYNIRRGWVNDEEEKRVYFRAWPLDLNSKVPDYAGGSREAPYAIAHPVRIRHKLKFLVDDTWYFVDEKVRVDHDALSFSKTSTFKNDIYLQDYQYRSHADNIAAEDFEEVMADIANIELKLGAELENSTGWFAKNIDSLFGGIVALWAVGAISFAIISFWGAKPANPELPQQLVFYPVKIPKFILLSFLSFGVYQLFWFFKNWQWIRKVRDEELWPLVRVIFAPITNFSLFSRMSDEGESLELKTVGWFKICFLPLAILYFLGGAASRFANLEAVPDWVSLLSLAVILIPLPVAIYILQLNSDRPELVAQNSKFTWRTYGFIAITLPVFLLAALGAAVIISEL